MVLEAGLFSLRLGHATALTCHWHVIHSRGAASLPLELPRGPGICAFSGGALTVSKVRMAFHPHFFCLFDLFDLFLFDDAGAAAPVGASAALLRRAVTQDIEIMRGRAE